MFKVSIDYKNGRLCEWETLTSGSVGPRLQFEFSSEWEGLVKTVCFDNGEDELPSVTLRGDSIEIPHEAMERAGVYLKAGVYGKTVDGQLVIPTVYISLGAVNQGAEKTKRPALPKTPDWTANIESEVNQAVKTANNVKYRADSGEFKGPDGRSAYEIAVQHGFNGTETQWIDFVEGSGKAAQVAVTKARENAERAKNEADRAMSLANKLVVDSTISDTSKRPVANDAIKRALDAKEDKGNLWELIETIQLNSSMMITRSADPDGNPYRFTSLVITVSVGCGIYPNGSLSVVTEGRKYILYDGIIYDSIYKTPYWRYEVDFSRGRYISKIFSKECTEYDSPVAHESYYANLQDTFLPENDYIAYINFYVELPKDSEIKIWAVRA